MDEPPIKIADAPNRSTVFAIEMTSFGFSESINGKHKVPYRFISFKI
jgi:hypothetical protein